MRNQEAGFETTRQRAFRHIAGRLGLVALGGFCVLYGLGMMHRGIMAYQNEHYRATTYSAGTIAAGIFIAILGLLPSSLVSWLSALKKPPHKDPLPHHRHHDPR